MDLRDTPDEAAFRAEVRAWIAENLPAELRGHRGGAERFEGPALREWSRKLSEAGYVGLTWPQEYGGRGAPYSYQAIFYEEAAAAESPPHVGVIGLGMAGPTIMAHGTEAQKARYLPKILSAEEIWCQGFSEPGAGSDLASLKTTAREEDGRFVLNGQNTGEAEFNEIFLTDVEVPRENLLGEVGGGWQVAITTLLHERATLGFALTAGLDVGVRKLIALARETGAADDALVRDRVAREWIELQGLRYTNYRALTALMQTGVPGPEGSAVKLHWSEQNQRLTQLALELHGAEAPLAGGYWQHQQLRSRGNTIEAGTSEVLRNIIAERVLGLPRSR
jgi:alkylation response protein AidB-like acyl-CoA dehydrogenase